MAMSQITRAHKTLTRLLGATALVAVGQIAIAQDGFSIAINGQQIAGDTRAPDPVRRADLAIQQADVQVSFDGLGADKRLDLEIAGTQRSFAAGEIVSLQSELNYPAYVTRAEVRIVDATSGGTVLATDIAPNGQVSVRVPEGDNLAVVHRVYDAQGRFDETRPIRLAGTGGRSGAEEGDSNIARTRIPVYGGAVTVSGENVTNGATVTALGERVATGRDGRFVIQRILPAGDYGVDVSVQGAGQNVALERQLEIPASQWFYVGTIDLTYGARRVDGGDWDQFNSGQVGFFVEGRRADGWEITASANSGEGPIEDIFRRFDDRDPRQVLLRIPPEDLYPTYGDDSTIEDRTPTSGNLFFRAAREGSYVQWGDFDADLSTDGYVRNERRLYGLSALYTTPDQTTQGEPRAQAYYYAAQPDQLPQRDVLLGTGGSVYFLDKQDIARATETVSVQTRDRTTGRVLSNRQLEVGVDYQVNYIQGIVTLARPLQSTLPNGVVASALGEGTEVVLVAQYEYTPTLGDVSGYSYGGRAEAWVTDQLRLGVSGMLDQTGVAEQSLVGADVTFQMTEQTYARLEFAQSKGPGFGSTFSADGGLIFGTQPLAAGTGQALKFAAQAALSDLVAGTDGTVSLYYEDRREGFSTLDTQVTAATGDEVFWGAAADFAVAENVRVAVAFDDYENAVGDFDRTASADIVADLNPQLTLTAGIATRDVASSSDTGQRTDAALRLDYAINDSTSIYGYGQGTITGEGLVRNDRAGLGATVDFENGWELGAEISDGTNGAGGRLLASYTDGQGNTRYAGYQLDPTRTLGGIDLRGRDRGQLVVGGREQVSDTVAVFGENTYDMFGDYQSLTSAYGVTFTPTNALTSTVAIEFGRVEDDRANDFDRNAISVGLQYATDDIEASGRVEYRTEDGRRAGTNVASDTLLMSADLAYKLDEDQRLVASADLARTQTNDSAILDGDYSDITLGYAYRPAELGRFNMLARYRYLQDEYGQRLDGTDERGPLQRSHVASVDMNYNLDQNWTLGAKVGYRASETAANAGDTYAQNDAWLAVANARYHLVNDWDVLLEVRSFNLVQAETSDLGVLAAGYKQLNENVSLGVGYNFGRFSDDLTDMVQDDEGIFVNLVANF